MKKYWVDAKVNMKDSVTYNYTPSLAARNAFFYLQSIGHFHCDEDYFTRREGFRSYLLIYTVSGKGYANYRDRHYELRKGQVLLMDCYDFQEYYTDKEDLWDMKWMHFNGSTSREYYNTIFEKSGPVANMYDNLAIPLFLDGIMKLAKDGDMQLEVKVSKLIVGILTELLLSVSQKNEKNNIGIADSQIRAALDFVEGGYYRGIALKDMAAAACSSIFHFSRTFKKVMGYSPYEYLVKYRVTMAKKLLESTEDSIDEIAGSVGFCSTSNFVRTFKTIEGMTPLKYRKYWTG